MSLSIHKALTEADLPLGEARLLLQAAMGNVSKAYLIAHPEVELSLEQEDKFTYWIKQRLQGQPLAYILQEREFWGRSFICRPGVLIPRPDTETLLEAALEKFDPKDTLQLLDLGCGSGILAVSLACEFPHANIVAVDRSATALKITQENARRYNVANRIHLVQSDWLHALASNSSFDMIVSNPPYIAENDPHLQQGDLIFEPREALSSNQQGYQDIFHLIDQSNPYLVSGGWLLLEHGYNQGDSCYYRFNRTYWKDPQQYHDLAGWVRVTGAQKI